MFELLTVSLTKRPIVEGNFREFRLFITDVNGATNAQLGEMELFDSAGFNRLRVGTVTSSASTIYGAMYGPEKLIDGDPEGKWTSRDNNYVNQWVSYVIQEPMKPVRLTLQHIQSINEAGRMPKNFRLETKNTAGGWDVLYTGTNQTNWGSWEKRSFNIVY